MNIESFIAEKYAQVQTFHTFIKTALHWKIQDFEEKKHTSTEGIEQMELVKAEVEAMLGSIKSAKQEGKKTERAEKAKDKYKVAKLAHKVTAGFHEKTTMVFAYHMNEMALGKMWASPSFPQAFNDSTI